MIKNIEKNAYPDLFDLIASFVLHDGSLFSHLITELFMKTYNVDLDRFDELVDTPVETQLIRDFRCDLMKTSRELIRVLAKVEDVDQEVKGGWPVTMKIDYNRFPIRIADNNPTNKNDNSVDKDNRVIID